MNKVFPLLITDKLNECAVFYTRYFGFAVVYEKDWYIQLLHRRNGAELGFMAPQLDSQPDGLRAGFNGEGMVYGFAVSDAGAEYERLRGEPGVAIVMELKDEPWGQRHFIVRDPAGIFVDVVQQLKG